MWERFDITFYKIVYFMNLFRSWRFIAKIAFLIKNKQQFVQKANDMRQKNNFYFSTHFSILDNDNFRASSRLYNVLYNYFRIR